MLRSESGHREKQDSRRRRYLPTQVPARTWRIGMTTVEARRDVEVGDQQ